MKNLNQESIIGVAALLVHAARIDGDNANGLYSRTGSVTSLSDQRLKKNIQDLTYSMDEFKALKPRTFEWI